MSLSEDIERLRRIPLLGILDDEALRMIAFNGQHASAGDGDTLFFAGEKAPGALVLIEGALSLQEYVNGAMKERDRLGPGAIADPYALMSEIRRAYTAKAVGDVDYMALDRVTFLKIMQNYPDMAQKVQDYLADDIERIVSSLTGVADRLDVLG